MAPSHKVIAGEKRKHYINRLEVFVLDETFEADERLDLEEGHIYEFKKNQLSKFSFLLEKKEGARG